MKARLYTTVSLVAALSAMTFVTGYTQQDANQPSPEPAPATATEKKLPPQITPSGPTAEVIKLAQAGVDDMVMLNFITNAASMFSLSSDDIIYLNDLGVASTVVTAMIQHDQGLKTSGQFQVAVQPAPATATTDVNPPPPAQVEVAPAQPTVVNDNYFYDSLAPYGTWVEVDGYGRCWQPTVVVANPGWQPYCDRGHWVYTDSGWYWMSDYSWGWAAFHYGRWFNHPRWGWCWWPDRVWAPSWVSWRYSGDYCGWAALPPAAYYRPGFGFSYYGNSVGFGFDFGLSASCFTFVPWGHFRDSRPYHHRLPHDQVTQIYNQTTIINNYGSGRNGTVINHGIPADRVREHTHADLRPVRIREHSEIAGSGRVGRVERLEQTGHSLVVNRPHIPESAAARPLTSPPPRLERPRGNVPVSGVPTYNRNAPAPTIPATAPANPPQDGNRGTPRARENRPGNRRDSSQRPTVPPLIVYGSSNTRPAPQSTPANSTAVTSRREGNLERDRAGVPQTETRQSTPRGAYNWSAPAYSVREFATTTPAPSTSVRSYAPVAQSPRSGREEYRYTPSYTAPRQTSSGPVYPTTPAPVQRSYSSTPAYSAPPAPAPSRSQSFESRSTPERASSGRDGGGNNNQNRRNN